MGLQLLVIKQNADWVNQLRRVGPGHGCAQPPPLRSRCFAPLLTHACAQHVGLGLPPARVVRGQEGGGARRGVSSARLSAAGARHARMRSIDPHRAAEHAGTLEWTQRESTDA